MQEWYVEDYLTHECVKNTGDRLEVRLEVLASQAPEDEEPMNATVVDEVAFKAGMTVKLKSGKTIPKLEKKQEEKTEQKPFTDFRTLRLAASKRSKKSVDLSWRKYDDADGYLV